MKTMIQSQKQQAAQQREMQFMERQNRTRQQLEEKLAREADEQAQYEADVARMEREELELLIAELSAESEMLSGDGRITEAELSLESAHEELRGFEEWGMPDQIREAELDVERSEVRLEEERGTLEQLESDYARFSNDALAKKTAEIVLGRHRARVRFSEVELELAHRELEHLSLIHI